eukprot:c18559_g1_i1.p1 GENE.c18559_g1_i1~~c18559_g1_i1.p1  ORF type:complete len:120 (+),score=25.64 c18559_g1_i1:56-361(+)
MVVILIGNKCDLAAHRAVQHDEGAQFAAKNGLLFMETSAKTAFNVDEAFLASSQAIHKLVVQGKIDASNASKYGVSLGEESRPSAPPPSACACSHTHTQKP